MILTSHQPNFLPYMGVFYKAYRSDILVLSDDVQFSKKGMHNWNYIRTKDGQHKITVPVIAHHDTPLRDIKICEPEVSMPRIIKTLRETYARTEYFREGEKILDLMEGMIKPDLGLVEMNRFLILYILYKFKMYPRVIMATKDLGIEGHKDDRILQMCHRTLANVYYSGTGAKVYHDEERYKAEGIELVYSDYHPVTYRQKYSPFLQNMSVIDYIFNEGYSIPEEWK